MLLVEKRWMDNYRWTWQFLHKNRSIPSVVDKYTDDLFVQDKTEDKEDDTPP
jgi:hypothetical protein